MGGAFSRRKGLDGGYVVGLGGRSSGEEGLGDGEVLPPVVDFYVGFLEEGAAEGVLRVVGRAAEGEVVLLVVVCWEADLEIEGAVGERDVYI